MATTQLYSVKAGEVVDWELTVDDNGEIVATSPHDEALKFPGDVTKTQLNKLFKEHNKKNENAVALTDEEIEAQDAEREKAQKLIDSL